MSWLIVNGSLTEVDSCLTILPFARKRKANSNVDPKRRNRESWRQTKAKIGASTRI